MYMIINYNYYNYYIIDIIYILLYAAVRQWNIQTTPQTEYLATVFADYVITINAITYRTILIPLDVL